MNRREFMIGASSAVATITLGGCRKPDRTPPAENDNELFILGLKNILNIDSSTTRSELTETAFSRTYDPGWMKNQTAGSYTGIENNKFEVTVEQGGLVSARASGRIEPLNSYPVNRGELPRAFILENTLVQVNGTEQTKDRVDNPLKNVLPGFVGSFFEDYQDIKTYILLNFFATDPSSPMDSLTGFTLDRNTSLVTDLFVQLNAEAIHQTSNNLGIHPDQGVTKSLATRKIDLMIANFDQSRIINRPHASFNKAYMMLTGLLAALDKETADFILGENTGYQEFADVVASEMIEIERNPIGEV